MLGGVPIGIQPLIKRNELNEGIYLFSHLHSPKTVMNISQ